MYKSDIICVCPACNREFGVGFYRYQNRTKKGQKHFFCSHRCAGGVRYYTNIESYLARLMCHVRQSCKRKKLDLDIDIKYLVEIWNNQNGLCYITKLPMSIDKKHTPFQVSIDRIDSSKGYIKDNICLVCLSVNLAKNSFSYNEILNFFNNVKMAN